MKIQVLDLGINNLASLIKAIENVDQKFQIEIISSINGLPSTIKPNLLILPGVGNFGAAMKVLRARNLDTYIHEFVQSKKRLIGICLGMQLLLHSSEESPDESGLGIIPGNVRKLSSTNERVPNVGWNEINYSGQYFQPYSLSPDANYYFTHSFFADVSADLVLATSLHGKSEFPAVIGNGSALGIQFHPEKSGLEGKRFLKAAIESQID